MIPVFRPCLGQEEFEAVKAAMESGWIGLGPRTKEFEEQFAAYIGVKHAIGTNSGTAALHLALWVADVEGGEVITTPLTFVSTNHAILYNRATPVFCDIEGDTLNIDADQIEKLVTPKTRAIMVVHYGGHACDMDKIMAIARRHSLKVIDDCAHASGGEYKGKKLGAIADIGCFSFHAVKQLTCGEGGMITTHDDEYNDRLRKLRWVGINKDTWSRSEIASKYDWYYTVEEVGLKYHLSDIPAAIGMVQLRKLDAMNARRREIVSRYNEAFKDLPWLEIPVEKEYARSALHNYVPKVERRDDFVAYLSSQGVATSVHYFPNHLYDIYRPYRRELPVTDAVWKKIVTLPLFPDLTDSQVGEIIEAVRSFGRLLGAKRPQR